MLNNFTKTINFSASSTIDGQIALYMGASVRNDGEINLNQSIRDSSIYIKNRQQVEEDFEEFKGRVIGNVNG